MPSIRYNRPRTAWATGPCSSGSSALTSPSGVASTSRTRCPSGALSEVRDAARELFDDFMPGGGFVFAAGHNIQADVPAENILALFDAAEEFGRY